MGVITAVRPGALVGAEVVKLASVRSPWWCVGAAALGAVTVNGLLVFSLGLEGSPVTPAGVQLAASLGMGVVMVMACLAVTGEYAVGTIRTTFLAVPRRGWALSAKAVVVAALGLVVGLVVGFASWGVAQVLAPGADLLLDDGDAWRQVAGTGPVYAVAAVFALAVGILVRHTAGALAIVLGWALLVEQLIGEVPGTAVVVPWLPFHAAKQFVADVPPGAAPLDRPWIALAWFVIVTGGLLAVALGVARRRDV